MSEYDNTNRGALFKNDKKETDGHPDYKGSINVGGVDYWLSAWIKTSKGGAKYMSLSVKAKEGAAEPAKAAARGSQIVDQDLDVPF